jgi:hypothetical protein
LDQAAILTQESQVTIPEKIHIRGVDDLTTEDIIAFAAEYSQPEAPKRIEWIDDTSANIVFNTAAITSDALNRLSLDLPIHMSLPPTQLRMAKAFSKYPESRLEIRIAFSTDQKRPRAHEASRFYMMHPEHDPREKRRREPSSRSHEHKRRRYDSNEHRRRKELDGNQGFSPGMYDGPVSYKVESRRTSFSTHSSFVSSDERNADGQRHPRRRRGDFYRPEMLSRSGGASRDRSASPGQRLEMRNGRRTPPRAYQTRHSSPAPVSNSGKELFPSNSVLNINRKPNGRELFPNKISASALKKELFPNKAVVSNHRRSDAFDAADETADLFASGPTSSNTALNSRRNPYSKPFSSSSNNGRLQSPEVGPKSPESDIEERGGLNIRGISKLRDLGISIRGAAGDGHRVGKIGNASKELFAEKLAGRGGRRNKAHDMFY